LVEVSGKACSRRKKPENLGGCQPSCNGITGKWRTLEEQGCTPSQSADPNWIRHQLSLARVDPLPIPSSDADESTGTCPRDKWGTETVREEWECHNGGSSCTGWTELCSDVDGSQKRFGGTDQYSNDGNFFTSTGGWDCRQKCRDCNFSCSGSETRTKRISSESGSSGGGGVGGGGGSGSQDCDYQCTDGGGCQVTYVGPPRSGKTKGACFPERFAGGKCSGTPSECQDCNKAINC